MLVQRPSPECLCAVRVHARMAADTRPARTSHQPPHRYRARRVPRLHPCRRPERQVNHVESPSLGSLSLHTLPRVTRGPLWQYLSVVLGVAILEVGLNALIISQGLGELEAISVHESLATPSVFLGWSMFGSVSVVGLASAYGMVEWIFADLNDGYVKSLVSSLAGRYSYFTGEGRVLGHLGGHDAHRGHRVPPRLHAAASSPFPWASPSPRSTGRPTRAVAPRRLARRVGAHGDPAFRRPALPQEAAAYTLTFILIMGVVPVALMFTANMGAQAAPCSSRCSPPSTASRTGCQAWSSPPSSSAREPCSIQRRPCRSSAPSQRGCGVRWRASCGPPSAARFSSPQASETCNPPGAR